MSEHDKLVQAVIKGLSAELGSINRSITDLTTRFTSFAEWAKQENNTRQKEIGFIYEEQMRSKLSKLKGDRFAEPFVIQGIYGL